MKIVLYFWVEIKVLLIFLSFETHMCLVLFMNKMGIDYMFETMSEYVTW